MTGTEKTPVIIGGFFRVGADALNGSTAGVPAGKVAQDQLGAGVTNYRGRLNFSGTNDEETFGGFLRLQADATRYWNQGGRPPHELVDVRLAWVWWQPIQMVKAQAGILDDFYVDEIVNEFGGNAEQVEVHNRKGASFVRSVGYGTVPSYTSPLIPVPGYDPATDGESTINGAGDNPYSFDDAVNEAFPPEFTKAGAALSVYPIEGLSINIGLPFVDGTLAGGGFNYGAERVYKAFLAQVQYDINDIGRVTLAFQGKMGAKRAQSSSWNVFGGGLYNAYAAGANAINAVTYDDTDSGTIYLGFYFTMVENLRVNFGFAFPLPHTETWEGDNGNGTATAAVTGTAKGTKTTQDPILIGLGATYDLNDAFRIAARIGVGLGASTKEEVSLTGDFLTAYNTAVANAAIANSRKLLLSRELAGNTGFGIQLLPSYDLGILKVFLNCGLTITAFADNEDKDLNILKKRADKVGFWVNPYVEKTMGSGSFFIGIDLYTDGAEVNGIKLTYDNTPGSNANYVTVSEYTYADAVLNWRIPCGMKFSF